ncbi:MAG: EAL domain-containing protein [Treponema sp.]|nr:EAL domain-containing protein [Treponema sp.]
MKKSFLSKVKDFFYGLSHSSDYTKDFLFNSDIRSNFFIGVTVICLETFMLLRLKFKNILTDVIQDSDWIRKHVCAYLVLLAAAVILVFYSFLYKKSKTKSRVLGKLVKDLFCVVSISFGLYMSYISLNPTSQVFAFLTMEIFVLCIYAWTPLQSLLISVGSFGIYIYLQSRLGPVYYGTKINSFTAWLFLYACALNTFYQKKCAAQEEEKLESLLKYVREKSSQDELTGLPNLHKFQYDAMEFLKKSEVVLENWRFVFMDIGNFKNYNEKYGFSAGNAFLKIFGQYIIEEFPDELVARYSDDHFIVLAEVKDLEQRLDSLHEKIRKWESDVQMTLKAGFYMPKDQFTLPGSACDYARYACESIKKNYTVNYIEYNTMMHKEFNRKKYIVNSIDNAIKNGYIKVFYQPVVWAADGKLCGAEALARWDDPDFGFLQPGAFISILEEYHLIHKLDMAVLEIVCRDLREAMDKGLRVFPISINFSRLDFELLNLADELDSCMERYGIDKDLIHVEVTESMLGEGNAKLTGMLNNLRERGYSLWLDDFGSGYSGLNVLKDYSFDMMKIDMNFLSKFSENKKSQPVLTSIVDLAGKIGMKTLSEGVETNEAYDFLRSIGCQRLQGYLFGKPMLKSELVEKIHNGTYVVSELAG